MTQQKAKVRLSARTLPNPDKMSVQVLQRAFGIIDLIAASPTPLILKEIATQAGLHTSTAHRILSDLVFAGFLEHGDNGQYLLGLRLLQLGTLVKDRLNIREVAMPAMQWLHKETNQTVNLSIRQGNEIVYIERIQSPRSGMLILRAIGGRAPLHLTSAGKLYLAAADPSMLKSYILCTGLRRATINSVACEQDLERELAFVRQYGYARDNEELEIGVRCMAAAIYDNNSQLVAGLSLSSPVGRMQDSWCRLLIRAAANISTALGYGRTAITAPE